MTPLTLAKLAEIEAAAAQATPGPWIPTIPPEGEAQVFSVESVDKNDALADCFCFADEQDKANAFYIALCDPATVAALVRIARAAVEGTITDALRYRWLRQRHWNDSPMCVVKNPKEATKLGAWCPYGELLDAEIDAAMK